MKIVYIVYFEDYGEYQVAATEDGEILDIWACNDAMWRNEYFHGFMKRLGFEVREDAPAHIVEKMRKFRIDTWGEEE